jgi:hypothetical protein
MAVEAIRKIKLKTNWQSSPAGKIEEGSKTQALTAQHT